MVDAQNPLVFIVSEPVGSPTANEIAYRLADHGVRTWIGSLAPSGELKEQAMDALRSSVAVLLVFDEAAAQSRHVDRHLLVARQMGKPLIPLRLHAADEGLLRQELLDAQWIDGAAPEPAIAEISRRAFDYDRAQREGAGRGVGDTVGMAGAGAAAGAGIGAATVADQAAQRPRIQVVRAGPTGASQAESDRMTAPFPEQAAPRPAAAGPPFPDQAIAGPVAARTGRRGLGSPTLLLALLALAVVVGAILYNTSLFRPDGDRLDRTVEREPVDYSANPRGDDVTAAPVDAGLPVDEPAPAADAGLLPAPAPTVDPLPAAPPPQAEPAAPAQQEVAVADAAPPAAPADNDAAAASGGVATVRSFYSALSRGDGASAAQYVIPSKRQSGPLSGPSLTRYFSSFRRPLRVRQMTPVDANTVRVAYDYVLSDGRLCEGVATVNVVQSGGRGLVSGINTRGPC